MLSLPEVIDGAIWWPGKLRYVDAKKLMSSGGTISLLNRAPHPNGAECSSTGCCLATQSQVQNTDGSDSLRIDIPKDSVLSENRRLTSVEYLDGDDRKVSDRRPADKLLNEILK